MAEAEAAEAAEASKESDLKRKAMWAAKADAAPSTPFVSFARPPGSPEPKAVYPLIGSGAPLTPPKDGYKPSFLMQVMATDDQTERDTKCLRIDL